MRLGDLDALEEKLDELERYVDEEYHVWIPNKGVYDILNNAATIARTERPFVMIEGKVIYITQGHIDALLEYEKKELSKEAVDRLIDFIAKEDKKDGRNKKC
jgi:hypothetical protein